MSKHNNEEQLFEIFEYTNSKTYDVYINEEIKEPRYYTKLFNLFRSVNKYDMIQIHINSPGGNIHTGNQLINCMRSCQAHVVTNLDGEAMSLAPLILLSGDEIIVGEHAIMMFHDFSVGSYSKGNEMLSMASAYNEFYKNMLEKYAYPFLNKKEIKSVIKGQDIYMETQEILDRLEKFKKFKNEETDE